MWIGILGVIMSGICGLLAGRMTDIVYGHVRISLIFLMISTVACFYWFFLLTWGSIPVTTCKCYFVGFGFCIMEVPFFVALILYLSLCLSVLYYCQHSIATFKIFVFLLVLYRITWNLFFFALWMSCQMS